MDIIKIKWFNKIGCLLGEYVCMNPRDWDKAMEDIYYHVSAGDRIEFEDYAKERED